MRSTENLNAYSWLWSIERVWLFSTTMSNHGLHNQCFKTWRKWTREVLPHPPYSPGLLPTNYHFFKHLNNFLQGKCFHNQQEAENAFQEFFESQSADLHATGINELFSQCKIMLLVTVPILINKDVFKPNYLYNHLEFMIQNLNYVCTNLIFVSLALFTSWR